MLCVGVSDFLDNVVGTPYLRESCGLEDLLFLSPSPPLLFRAPTPHFALVPVGTPPHKTNELHQNRSFRIYQFPAKSGSLLLFPKQLLHLSEILTLQLFKWLENWCVDLFKWLINWCVDLFKWLINWFVDLFKWLINWCVDLFKWLINW